MSINHRAAMVSQYFPTFYSNGTQKRLAQYSQGFQTFVHKMFGKYCTEIERERYRKGKRAKLPCDEKKDMQLYQDSSQTKNEIERTEKENDLKTILNVLKHHKNCTAKEIQLLTNIDTARISSIIIPALRRGEIEKIYNPSKSQRRDVCIYNLMENSNE